MAQAESLEALLQAVQRSPKYKVVSLGLIRRIGAQELERRANMKAAVKATKKKLHQVGGAYFEAKVDYGRCLAQLEEAGATGDPEAFRGACREVMRLHASTRERLDILDEFYATTLAGLPPIRSVADIACGFNPLAWGWMPFDAGTTYYAYDIYADLVTFVNAFMTLAGIEGRAEVRDVVSNPPVEPVDLALLLKTLPCLAQIDSAAVPRLLDGLQARYLLISFPAQSLGGRAKGMVQNYEAQFQSWAAGRPWQVKRFEFASELAFLVQHE